MKCSSIQNKLELYIGGDLPEKQAASIEKHLRECEACAAMANELTAANHHLKVNWEREISAQPEIDLWPGVHRQIVQTPIELHKNRWQWFAEYKFRVAVFSFTVFLIAFFFVADLSQKIASNQPQLAAEKQEEFYEDGSYPIVEELNMDNAYYMEIKSSNPDIQIIWIIREVKKS